MKNFKQFMKDIEPSPEENAVEEDQEVQNEEEVEDEIKEFGPPGLGQSHQDQERDAWYKGDDHHANWKKANPNVNKKEPVKKKQGPSKKTLTTGIAGQKGNTGRNEKE